MGGNSPPVRVPVAVDVTPARAARRGALKNIFIHCKNLMAGERKQGGRLRVRGPRLVIYISVKHCHYQQRAQNERHQRTARRRTANGRTLACTCTMQRETCHR